MDAGDAPPTEFRIFSAGTNRCPLAGGATGDGTYLFTEESATIVMAEYERRGVDLPIDLDHGMAESEAPRPDSRDARGWFKLEIRAGELWAVDVKFTPDGERRLRERTQRYISPAFSADSETREIIGLVNCALVAMPATEGAPALVAASARAHAPMSEADKDVCRKALKMIASGTRV